MTVPLVRSDTFIRATRETGYRSTAFAIAELIDNAIQASAEVVNIVIDREDVDGSLGLSIAVIDDGVGMNREQLAQALQFGGSSRFDNRTGQGRFGMGLPNASLSQARQIDVFTWRDKEHALHTALDSDAIATGRATGPSAVADVNPPLVVQRIGVSRGTAVVWSRCDRIAYQRPGTLARNLHRELGRIYRGFIGTQIHVLINGETVRRIDPIAIEPKPKAEGDVTLLPPLLFAFQAGGGSNSNVRVTFAILPVGKWAHLSNDEKRNVGISGSGTVSIVRAGREIALGWFLMGAKRREHYDDWWRCEIAFDPALDELFGVSHSKQGIRPVPTLVHALAPTLENQARLLNQTIRERFAALKDVQQSAENLAEAVHHKMFLAGERVRCSLPGKRREQRIVSPTYAIDVRPSSDAAFLSARRRLNNVILSLNSNHPFYHLLYTPMARESSHTTRRAFELSLLALGRVLASARPEDRESWSRLMEDWSNASALLLEER